MRRPSPWLFFLPLVLACGADDVGELTDSSSGSSGTSSGTSAGPTSESPSEPTSTGSSSTGPVPTTDPTTGPTTVDPTTGPDPSTTTTDTGTETGTETDPGGDECCEVELGPGCGDAAIQACVCEQDPFCCDEQWDFTCVGEVAIFGCGQCPSSPELCCEPQRGPTCGADPALSLCVCELEPACCTDLWNEDCVGLIEKSGCGTCGGLQACCEVSGGPGCAEDPVEECVCAAMPECCEGAWGEACVAAVEGLGCGMCEPPPPPGECCEPGEGPGCTDPMVQACVCEAMPACCEDQWTDACAAAVEGLMCGQCGEGECCTPQDGPGCGQADIEQCVCAQDPFCCDDTWDAQCVGEVESFACGSCGGMGGDCCAAGMGPGCDDLGIQECVCDVASSCCDSVWSDACAALVEPLGCGMCNADSTACCDEHDTPSCDDQMIADCVCALDDFCCVTMWDGQCVAEVEQFGCGMC